MSEFLVLLKRELKSITKEKTIVFAVIIQFFIAAFSSVILIGIMAFYDPGSISENTHVIVRVGVVGDVESPMLGYLQEKNIRTKLYTDLNSAEAAFRSGKVDTIVSIPEQRSGVVDMKLTLPEMDIKKTVVLMVLDEPLKKYENFLREANGVKLNYGDVSGKPHTTYEFLYSLIVPILMLFPALIAGSIVIDTVSEELENKTFDTLMSAPVSLGQVLASKVSAAIVTAVIQIAMWIGLLRLNNIVIQDPALVLMLAILITATLSIGTAIIALYFKDRERAQFVYSIVLVALIGGSYFLDPSPFSVITRLAAGDANIGLAQVALYVIPVVAIGIVFLNVSKRLVWARR